MITKINTSEDVKAFAKQLIEEGVSFHPEDDFNDYEYFKENKRVLQKKKLKIEIS